MKNPLTLSVLVCAALGLVGLSMAASKANSVGTHAEKMTTEAQVGGTKLEEMRVNTCYSKYCDFADDVDRDEVAQQLRSSFMLTEARMIFDDCRRLPVSASEARKRPERYNRCPAFDHSYDLLCGAGRLERIHVATLLPPEAIQSNKTIFEVVADHHPGCWRFSFSRDDLMEEIEKQQIN